MNAVKLLPVVMQLGEYLKMGIDHYATLKDLSPAQRTDALTGFLVQKLSTWDPTVSGRHLMDEETRYAAARFLAGVATNLAS